MRNEVIGGISGGFLGGVTGVLSQRNYEAQLRLQHPDWSDQQIKKAVAIRKLKAGAIGTITGGGLGSATIYGINKIPYNPTVKPNKDLRSIKNRVQNNSKIIRGRSQRSNNPTPRTSFLVRSNQVHQPSQFEQLQNDRWAAGQAVIDYEARMGYDRSDRNPRGATYNDDPTYRRLLDHKRSLDRQAHNMRQFEDKKQFSIIEYTSLFSSSDRVVCMFYDKGEGTDHLTKPCTLIEVPKIKREFQDKAKRSRWRIVDLVVAQDMDEVDELIEEYE